LLILSAFTSLPLILYSSLKIQAGGYPLYRAPRGTSDILPQEQPHWQYIEQKVTEFCQLYGYERIVIPTFEDSGLFVRTAGEGTDIVEKEMYTFEDKGGNRITLRPECTASVCRAYLEHGMNNLTQPVKLYCIASIFRYERPQAGRYREHHQFNFEAIGDADPAIDAEVIDMARRFFTSLELQRLTLKLNSIGCRACRPKYLAAIRDYYARYADDLCPDCKTRLARNPLRLLDCKTPACQAIAEGAPKSIDYLCPDCAEHFDTLRKYLGLLELPFVVDHRLVRGLDYYTRTVFEIQPEAVGAQSTIGGGGRYDNLIEELGGKPTPAIGFATGMERIVLNLKEQNIAVSPSSRLQAFVASVGGDAKDEMVRLASHLRQEGIGVIEATGERSLKAQLRQANSLGVPYAVIIGEEEMRTGTVVLRDMANARQETVPVEKLPDLLKKSLPSG
jgi:histidyl-tRNA synthetase